MPDAGALVITPSTNGRVYFKIREMMMKNLSSCIVISQIRIKGSHSEVNVMVSFKRRGIRGVDIPRLKSCLFQMLYRIGISTAVGRIVEVGVSMIKVVGI